MDTLLKTSDNVLLVGLVVISVAGICLALDKSYGKSLLTRVSFRGRKASTAKTPPRSLSPEKKPTTGPTSPSSYADVLPPQRRQALANLTDNAVPWRTVDEKEVKANILPMTMDYRSSPDEIYTPTGFSVGEIKALGNFPDYAELSGVPLPRPYHEFNIDSALPRPYRPFRWAYHQTMCMFTHRPGHQNVLRALSD